MNELLSGQVRLVEQYIDMARRLAISESRVARRPFKYTTLADTKRYIAKHKKPIITIDEALRREKKEAKIF